MSHTERVVVLIDMDCFYCQVEEKLNPALKGKPVAVVQYNAWRGGGIIAVNYQARERGVTRHMRGDEAKKKCPEIKLVRVPTVRGKADLTKYREAGKLVAKVLQTFTPLLERASVDEAYLDITEATKNKLANMSKEITLNQIKNTHVVGCDAMDFLYNLYNSGLFIESNLKLAFGGVITEEIRAAVYEQTGYTSSAGIAHNKILAKLACGLHKPNKQTILPHDSIEELYKNLPVHKIRSLGGKFGNSLSEDLGIKNMAELAKFTEKELKQRYDEKTGAWLYNIARGVDTEPVTTRLVSKSIGCCKKFPGKSALIEIDSVTHWLNELALEMTERLESDLEENHRKAKQMVISFTQGINGKDIANSRTHVLNSYDPKKITNDALEVIKKYCLRSTGTFCLKFLGISAGKFEDSRNVNEITSFFKTVNDCNKNTPKQNCCKRNNNNSIDSYFENSEKNDENEALNENFSDVTQTLDENSSELAFLNEIENVSDSDSISNELFFKNASESVQPEKESFFLRYFNNLKKQECEAQVPRDFDTSRILEDVDDENTVDSEEKNCVELNNSETSNFALNDIPSTSHDPFEYKEYTEVCKECSQKVRKSEMVSHMDYHVALKIVRDEAHLYKNNTKPAQQQTKDTKKSGKRKLPTIENNATLEVFIKSNVNAENSRGETKICPQCNKRIEATSFSSHLDYHAAKKLHMEINPVKSCVKESVKSSSSAKKPKGVKAAKNSITSVRAFFKPIS